MVDDFKRKTAEDMEKDVVFSHSVKAGKRIYYMDVRRTRKDEMYLSITESKKIVNGEGDNAQVSFEKHKIFLYREDFSNFIDGLTKAIRFIHENETAAPAPESDDEKTAQESSDEFKIEF